MWRTKEKAVGLKNLSTVDDRHLKVVSLRYPQYVHHHGRKEAFVVVAVVKLNSTFVTREAQI